MATPARAVLNVQACSKSEGGPRRKKINEAGRRGFLWLSTATTLTATTLVTDSRTALLNEYLKKSQENKDKNDKERLFSYYKRNYKDYFSLLEGDLEQKKTELTQTEKDILQWLKNNQ